MKYRISPRVLGLILILGIFSLAGFFMRGRQDAWSPLAWWKFHPSSENSPYDSHVKVNVTPRGPSEWDLEISGRYALVSVNSGALIISGTQLKKCKLGYRKGNWSLTPAPGGANLPEGSLLIQPVEGAFVRLERHRYRGELHLSADENSRPLIVNRIPLEHYVASVVDGEMPIEFGHEARCAQAVIARSYVLYQQRQSARKRLSYDVHADTRSQNYPGYQYQGKNGAWYSGESPQGRRCAEATVGMVCSDPDHGGIFCTYYSAVCGGRACRGLELFPDASPLLVAAPCEFCRPAPLYRWEKTVRMNRFQTRLQDFLRNRGAGTLDWKTWNGLEQPHGALPRFQISDGMKSFSLSGYDLRTLLGGDLLPSPMVSLTLKEKEVLIQGAGHGHGVGLCQWGARGMARQGKSFREILQFYYPGSRLVDYRTLRAPSGAALGKSPERNDSQVK